MNFLYFHYLGGIGMDKIFQTAIACNSLYGLIAMICMCIMLIFAIHNAKTVLLVFIKTYHTVHAKFNGTSVQTEIDVDSKAA